MTDMTVKKDPAILALEIRALQQQAESILTTYIIQIGRRLCEAKAVLDHGQWGPWLKDQVQFSQSTAQNYMKIYERFGSEQESLFGSAKSEALGNLPYTKALKLLAVPDEDMDSFLEENNVDAMSSRELEKAIRERDEARKALKEAREDAEEARAELIEEVVEAEAAAKMAQEDAASLRAELEELRSRPVDVAVREPDPALLDQIRAEEAEKAAAAAAELEKKLAAAEAKAAKEAEKAKKLKEKVDKAGEEAKAAVQKDIEAAEEARKAAEADKADAVARAEAAENKLKTANGDSAAFKVYFTTVQEDLNRMMGLIQKAEPARKEQYRSALRALLDTVGKTL